MELLGRIPKLPSRWLLPPMKHDGPAHFKCNELYRWKITFGKWFIVRLHHWAAGDPPQYQHAHPWNFVTLVLRGGYTDVGQGRSPDAVRAFAVRYRSHSWRHSVIDPLPHTWSIVITGPVVNKWRFWVGRQSVNEEQWNRRLCA